MARPKINVLMDKSLQRMNLNSNWEIREIGRERCAKHYLHVVCIRPIFTLPNVIDLNISEKSLNHVQPIIIVIME